MENRMQTRYYIKLLLLAPVVHTCSVILANGEAESRRIAI
jgi:hypothetical protein